MGRSGPALEKSGRYDEAIAVARRSIELQPGNSLAHYNLGCVLLKQGKHGDAAAAYRKSLALNPEYDKAQYCLGVALSNSGRPVEAEMVLRQLIARRPDDLSAYGQLGAVLHKQGQLPEAEAALRHVLKHRPDAALVHVLLGNVLVKLEHHPEAEAEYRRATELQSDLADAHAGLGDALRHQERYPEAAVAYRRAIECKPDFAAAYIALGSALRRQERYEESLDAYRRGHELGSKQPGWSMNSARFVHNAERLVALAPRLPALLSGETQPASADEYVTLAGLYQNRKLNRAAARSYVAAFTAEPKLAEELASTRYSAACAAALAACGQGKDTAQLDDTERAAAPRARPRLAGCRLRRLVQAQPRRPPTILQFGKTCNIGKRMPTSLASVATRRWPSCRRPSGSPGRTFGPT